MDFKTCVVNPLHGEGAGSGQDLGRRAYSKWEGGGSDIFEFNYYLSFEIATPIFRRNDNAVWTGDVEFVFHELNSSAGSDLDFSPSLAIDMEAALNSSIINRGTDNVFVNNDIVKLRNNFKLFLPAYQVKRSHFPRTITGLKPGEETSYENSQQCLVVITSCLCVFSVMEVVSYFIYLTYVSTF